MTFQKWSKPEVKADKPPPPKKAPARHVETRLDKTKASVLPDHVADVMNRRSDSVSAQELDEEMRQRELAMQRCARKLKILDF